METVGVFCGSQPGARPQYVERARNFGSALARCGAEVVCGAWGDDVSSAVAEAAWASGARVRSVTLHQFYEKGAADRTLGEIYLADSIHGCKALFYQMVSCIVILPSGFWALDVLIEAAILNHLKIQEKPIFLVNHEGFFEPFITLLDHLAAEGFLSAAERSVVHVAADYDEAIELVFRRPASVR